MGLFTRLSKCLSTRASPSVYFVSSVLLQFIPFFKLCICFAHELMCMWFGHSSFFHLMNISILGISDAVNECFRDHTSSDLFNFWCIPVLLFIFIPRNLKSSALFLEYFSTDFVQTLYKS